MLFKSQNEYKNEWYLQQIAKNHGVFFEGKNIYEMEQKELRLTLAKIRSRRELP